MTTTERIDGLIARGIKNVKEIAFITDSDEATVMKRMAAKKTIKKGYDADDGNLPLQGVRDVAMQSDTAFHERYGTKSLEEALSSVKDLFGMRYKAYQRVNGETTRAYDDGIIAAQNEVVDMLSMYACRVLNELGISYDKTYRGFMVKNATGGGQLHDDWSFTAELCDSTLPNIWRYSKEKDGDAYGTVNKATFYFGYMGADIDMDTTAEDFYSQLKKIGYYFQRWVRGSSGV